MTGKFRTALIAAAAIGIAINNAFAGDVDVVKAFYKDLLTKPAETTSESVHAVLAKDWKAVPVSMGGPGADGWATTLGIFGQIVPNMTMHIDEILQDGNRYIVRARATATPVAPFMGIDPPTGKGFEIMTIDIHTVENGKIITTYHIEEWASAIQQLRAK